MKNFDYTDDSKWQTPDLSRHIKNLIAEKEIAVIPRQAAELERTIGHAVHELYYRRQDEKKQAGQPLMSFYEQEQAAVTQKLQIEGF